MIGFPTPRSWWCDSALEAKRYRVRYGRRMTEIPEYLQMATDAEARAAALPPGFERDELLRKASAWRDIAELLRAQDARRAARK